MISGYTRVTTDPFLKLNCDASVSLCGARVGCGGLLRNANGDFIWAFSQRIPGCTVLEAELTAVYLGVDIAKKKGIRYLTVEMDNETAVILLSGDDVATSSRSATISARNLSAKIHRLLSPDMSVSWRWVPRSVNGAADGLARLEVDCGFGFYRDAANVIEDVGFLPAELRELIVREAGLTRDPGLLG